MTPNPVVMPAARVGTTASVSFTISGWTGKGGPQFSVGDGKVVPAEAEGNPQRFNLTMRVLQPGTQIRTLHVTDELGPQVDVPVVVRAAP